MPFYDSSDNYMPSKGKSGNGGKSAQGSNKPSAKASTSNGSKQKSMSSMPSSAKGVANKTGRSGLNKNLAGDNENSRAVNAKQKSKYPGKGNQPRGADSKASKQTSKAGKEKNLDSGTFF